MAARTEEQGQMPIDQRILNDSTVQTRRLEPLAARLSDEGLGRDLGDGWTVAVALAHLAFWDRRALYGLRRWAADGTPVNADDDHILNEALVAQWRALPARRAAEPGVWGARG